MDRVEHLEYVFINYATEDVYFSDWLALNLTSEGYKVWYDRLELLGGESFPLDIEDAIRNKTYVFIAILSNASKEKSTPLKERTLALKIAPKKDYEFYIPINLDLPSSEIDLMSTDLTYISFVRYWSKGFGRLIKKLIKINTPKPIKNGKEIAANSYIFSEMIENSSEILYSNVFNIKKLPEKLLIYKFNTWVTKFVFISLAKEWAYFRKNYEIVFSFHTPPKEILDQYKLEKIDEIEWKKYNEIQNIKTGNIISNLIFKALIVKCSQMGLIIDDKGRPYFPQGLLENDKIHFRNYNKQNTSIMTTGLRKPKIPGKYSPFKYYLSPIFKVKRTGEFSYSILLNLFLRITDEDGEELKKFSANAKRKKVRRAWRNHELLSRNCAILSFLSKNQEEFIIGELSNQQIVINTKLEQHSCPKSIIEKSKDDNEISDQEEIEYEMDIEKEFFEDEDYFEYENEEQ